MTDVVNRRTRSRMMAGIRGKHTKPERSIRSGLWIRGFRFALHRADLAGSPDLVLPRWQVVIEVHGCFWHGHRTCSFFRIPASRSEFWRKKILGNRARDRKNQGVLLKQGWRVITVWECALRVDPEATIDLVETGIRSVTRRMSIRAKSGKAHARRRWSQN